MDDNAEIKLKLLELRNKQGHAYYLICSGLTGILVFLYSQIDKIILKSDLSTAISTIMFVTFLLIPIVFILTRLWTEERIKYDVLLSKHTVSQEDLAILNHKDLIISVSTFIISFFMMVLLLAVIFGTLSYILALCNENPQDSQIRKMSDWFFRYLSHKKSPIVFYSIVIGIAAIVVWQWDRRINNLYEKYENILQTSLSHHGQKTKNTKSLFTGFIILVCICIIICIILYSPATSTPQIITPLFNNSFFAAIMASISTFMGSCYLLKRQSKIKSEEQKEKQMREIRQDIVTALAHLSNIVIEISGHLNLLYEIHSKRLDGSLINTVIVNLSKQNTEYEEAKKMLRSTLEKYRIYIDTQNILPRLKDYYNEFEVFYGYMIRIGQDLPNNEKIAIIVDGTKLTLVTEEEFFKDRDKNTLNKLPQEIEKIINEVKGGIFKLRYPHE